MPARITNEQPLQLQTVAPDTILDPALQTIAEQVESVKERVMSDAGRSIANRIKPTETLYAEKIDLQNVENKQLSDTADLLLSLKADLIAFDKKTTELPEQALEKLATLKEQGIDLWKGTKKVTPEMVDDLKNLVGAKADSLKMQASRIVVEKVQRLLSDLQSIMASFQTMLSELARVGKRACRIEH